MFTLKKSLNLILISLLTLPALSSENIKNLLPPDGFEISIFASKLESPRQITETAEGHIIFELLISDDKYNVIYRVTYKG